jgi:hypothetical protein
MGSVCPFIINLAAGAKKRQFDGFLWQQAHGDLGF